MEKDPSGRALRDWLAGLPDLPGVRPLDTQPAPQVRPAYRRRRPPGEAAAPTSEQEVVSLVREDGVLRWRAGGLAARGPRLRAGRAALPPGEVVRQYAFERLPGSKVGEALTTLDRTLTPAAAYPGVSASGLREWKNGGLVPCANPAACAGERVLLFIHGTFSRSEALLDEGLAKTPEGARLLADAVAHYDRVLAFDHSTLSVSPALNAFDLAALLRPAPAGLDIVCHSRGGLVARWLCEGFSEPSLTRRVLFVASPLGGTSLAAAPRLRSSLDLLANVADVLRAGADALAGGAFFLAAAGLLRVVHAVAAFTAKTPVLDAAIALVPGLAAQSAVGNNEELRRLRANTGGANFQSANLRYAAIAANFEPQGVGWNFLRLFSKPLQRLGDLGADLVFPGSNDLVVDTASMTEVADQRQVPLAHDFGTTDRVHHTNYFRQKETVAAIRATFAIP